MIDIIKWAYTVDNDGAASVPEQNAITSHQWRIMKYINGPTIRLLTLFFFSSDCEEID